MKKTNYFFILLVLAGIGAGVWFLVKQKEAQIGDYRGEPIEEIGNDPSLSHFPAAAIEQNKNRLKELVQRLKNDPKNFEMWTDVAELKKFFNNYKGALAVFEYAKTISPENPLAYYNLANMYGLYLHDYPKAEEYYLKAIDYGMNLNYTYLGLAEFYRDFYKDKSDLIDDVLLRGLQEGVPGDPNMTLQLAYYYKSIGDKKNAIKYFAKLINSKDVNGNQQQALQGEIKALSADQIPSFPN